MGSRSDKSVVITGAANGLGRALSLEFARLGYRLALLDINLAGLQTLAQELCTAGQIISIHQVDISREAEIITARKDILLQHGRVDILVNNAAISNSQNFEQLELKDFHRLFEVNFWGAVYCAKHFLPDLKKQEESRLVNIISDFALMGFPGKTTYGSSKSALMGFSYSLKTELAGSSTKLCLVIPPPMNTGIVKNNLHMDDFKKEREAALLEKHGMPTSMVARKTVKAIELGKFRIVIGMTMFFIDAASRLFPVFLHYLIAKNKKRFDFV